MKPPLAYIMSLWSVVKLAHLVAEDIGRQRLVPSRELSADDYLEVDGRRKSLVRACDEFSAEHDRAFGR